ncbi:MAG: glycosyltransferase [Anaerolineae bacterium]|nr:glycosyltransferase [Anaerolineae bacterium]
MMVNVCYFGAFDPDYPRNQIIRAGLAAHGVTISLANVDQRLPTRRKIAPLLRAYRRCPPHDVLVVPEFNQALVPLAWMVARLRRIPLIFDCLISFYDANVIDRQKARPGSARARLYYLLDRLAARLPDAVLVDTAVHRDYLGRLLHVPQERLHVVPVGAYDAWFHPMPGRAPDGQILAQFFGSYIPFHGVEHILRAAADLRARPDIAFELIGRGQTYKPVRALAEELDLSNVRFTDPAPPPDLPARLAPADIALGVFGAGAKTQRVVPNKVYQYLAMQKPLITADSAAVRDAFAPGEHLHLVPPADPHALAQAIAALADDPAARERLAAGGYRRIREAFTPGHIGAAVMEVLEQCRR